ncbi:hypothetical protein Ga0100231_002240 [Opitutaceae bacterium TAV4]|nr:hypothetical protein Ga0100231_002240 [Opitutaceae bacterium TAV4]RRK01778.1 hypothetical protein Ga0100230_000430 [Opitutaceae bacterium TAV3]
MIVSIADTGPLLHLHEAGVLHLLPLFAKVHVPSVVFQELQKHAPDIFNPDAIPWLTVFALTEKQERRARSWIEAGVIDRGEAGALALAEEQRKTQEIWFLTDDAAARLLAESLGIEVHGSLGVVLFAASQGLIGREEAERALRKLKESSLWLSTKVFASAWSALDEFFPKTG